MTLVWIGGVLVVLGRLWNLAWEGWADDRSGRASSVQSKVSTALLVLAAVLVVGPGLIALVAS